MEVSVELARMRDSSDTGPAPSGSTKKPPPPPGGTRREREYKRDPKGTTTGGQFTRNPSGASASKGSRSGGGSRGGGSKAGGAKGERRTPPPLEFGAKNDPDRVRFLQQLLKSLKVANLKVDGVFGEQTERAVMALQRKLGLTETGRVSNGLLKRIRDAEILSPCAKGAKRSKEMDELDEILRSVGLVDEVECDCDGEECDCEKDD
jgi:hypothetical protein